MNNLAESGGAAKGPGNIPWEYLARNAEPTTPARASKPIAPPAAKPKELMAEVAFTVAQSENGRLTKAFGLDASGKLKSEPAPSLSRGTAHRTVLSGTASAMAEELARWLMSFGDDKAIIPAPPPAGEIVWRLVTAQEAESTPGAIARTKKHFKPQPGPALMALDLDIKTYPERIRAKLKEAGGLSAALASVCPSLAKAACVTRPSVSSGIQNGVTGETSKATGQHRYYFALDGEDAPDFAQRLADRLALAGWRWGEVSNAGVIIFRDLFDLAASCDPSRLFYEANAVLTSSDLKHAKGAREAKVVQGGFLDTRALPPLNEAESAELARIKAKIAKDLEPERLTKRERWQAERVRDLVRKGCSPEAAQKAVSGAVERRRLEGGFLIELDNGQSATVREILANPAGYHKATCPDPLEPDYGGGRNIAIIYADGFPVRIHSHAHGGISYWLAHAAEDWFGVIDDDPPGVAAPGAVDPIGSNGGFPEPLDIFGHDDPSTLSDVPADALPEPIGRWARSEARRKGTSVIFPAVSALTVLAAAIGNSVRIQVREHDTDWTEPPALWTALVANPGRRKSPVMSAAVAPLRALDKEIGGADEAVHAKWSNASKKRANSEARGLEPRVRRFVVDDITLEKQVRIHRDNPRGILRAPDELMSLLGSLGAYKKNGDGDRSQMLSMIDGRAITVDRVSSGTARAESALMSVLVGTQPTKIQELARNLGADGLLQRFLFIVDDGVNRREFDEAPDPRAAREYERAVRYFATAQHGRRAVIRLKPSGYRILNDARCDFEKLSHLPGASGAWRGHLEKWGRLLPRIVLVFHALAQWDLFEALETRHFVDDATVRRAVEFSRHLLRHSLAFYETFYGAHPSATEARKIAGHFLTKPDKATFTRRDIYDARTELRGENRRGALFSAIRELEEAGWCAVDNRDAQGPTAWRVNPVIHRRFAEYAEREKIERSRQRQSIAEAGAARAALFGDRKAGVKAGDRP